MRIAVIGRGISGLSTAFFLASSGSEVDVFGLRSGGTVGSTGGVARYFYERSPILRLGDVVAVRTVYVRLGDKDIEIISNGDMGYVVKNMYKLVEKAEETLTKMGVSIFPRLVNPHKLPSKYDAIICADGALSTCRRSLGLPTPGGDDLHIGVQVDCNDIDLGHDIIIAHDNHTPKGYAWAFNIGDGYRIGYGVPKHLFNPEAFEKVITSTIGNIPSRCLRAKKFGSYISTSKPLKRSVYGKYILVGEAGGFIDPLTGGGLGWGAESGAIAAKHLFKSDGELEKLRKPLRRRYMLKRLLLSIPPAKIAEALNVMRDVLPKIDPTSFNPLEVHHLVFKSIAKKPYLAIKLVKLMAGMIV